MWIGVVTLFPEMFQAIRDFGVTGRAVKNGLVELNFWNPRDFTEDKHRTVDDRPYGGGPGMLMKVQPLRDAIQAAKQAACAGGDEVSADEAASELSRDEVRSDEVRVIYLSPQGRKLDKSLVCELAEDPRRMVLVAGRYEGIDERLLQAEIDDEISIGDFVLSGGELPAMTLIDAVSRRVPGVLGHEDSAAEDSFEQGLLDCPHYTRPEVIDGQSVPEVLLSGNHEAIRRWRLKQQLGRTWQRRPELLDDLQLNTEQQQLLEEFIRDLESQ